MGTLNLAECDLRFFVHLPVERAGIESLVCYTFLKVRVPGKVNRLIEFHAYRDTI
jgi:hypothetical protein